MTNKEIAERLENFIGWNMAERKLARAAAGIVRNHDIVRCGECRYLDTVECPGSHNLTAVQRLQFNSKTGIFTARGLKFCGAGERKDGEQ
jgi:hypothetical protein